MNKQNKISLKHGYTLTENEDGSIFLKVETEDDILELDGIEGNLMDASDFESHLSEDDEPMELTTAELRIAAFSFLTDWGVDKEATEAIIEDLTPWFERYAIDEPTADAWLKVLEDRVNNLKKEKALRAEDVTEAAKRFREWVAEAEEIDLIYDAESKARSLNKRKEAYTGVCNELRNATSELHRYKETMHIR